MQDGFYLPVRNEWYPRGISKHQLTVILCVVILGQEHINSADTSSQGVHMRTGVWRSPQTGSEQTSDWGKDVVESRHSDSKGTVITMITADRSTIGSVINRVQIR